MNIHPKIQSIKKTIIETKSTIKTGKIEPEKIFEVVVDPYSRKNLVIQTMPQPGSFYHIQLVLQMENS